MWWSRSRSTTSGDVVETRVLKSLGFGLDDVIVETLRKWRYQPAKIDGGQWRRSTMSIFISPAEAYRLHIWPEKTPHTKAGQGSSSA